MSREKTERERWLDKIIDSIAANGVVSKSLTPSDTISLTIASSLVHISDALEGIRAELAHLNSREDHRNIGR